MGGARCPSLRRCRRGIVVGVVVAALVLSGMVLSSWTAGACFRPSVVLPGGEGCYFGLDVASRSRSWFVCVGLCVSRRRAYEASARHKLNMRTTWGVYVGTFTIRGCRSRISSSPRSRRRCTTRSTRRFELDFLTDSRRRGRVTRGRLLLTDNNLRVNPPFRRHDATRYLCA